MSWKSEKWKENKEGLKCFHSTEAAGGVFFGQMIFLFALWLSVHLSSSVSSANPNPSSASFGRWGTKKKENEEDRQDVVMIK